MIRFIACCLLLTGSVFAQHPFVRPPAYAPNYPLNRFESEIRAFERSDSMQGRPANPILFIGSSSFRVWQTMAADLAPLPVLNRGFGGSTLPEVSYYANRVLFPYRPGRILVYAGDNDLNSGNHPQTPEQFAAAYARFVQMVQKRLPQTTIYFVSIKPSPSRWANWPAMQRANRLVKAFTKTNKKLRFIDVGPAMLGANGRPRPDIFQTDSLHMNATGYAIWAGILNTVLTLDARQNSGRATKRVQSH